MAQFRRIWLLLGVVLLVVPSTLLAQCGVERWSVKTGTDPDAGLVDLNSSTSTAITTLAALPAPNPIPANNRVAPTETTVWVINATLTKYKLEGDSDYHLVLSDAAGNTMIMEIPSPTCVGAGSPFLPGIQNARAKFDAMFTATTSFHTTSVPVQIFGVGMFDFLHGQTGVAPNGIELHPVLDLVFNPGTPTPDFTLSASPGSVSVAQGGSGSSTISTAVSGGFNSAISLSASGLPAGVTASLTPASIAAPGSGNSTLSFTASSTAATGTSNVTVTATGGGITHTSTVALTITAAGGTTTTQVLGNPGFENGSASPAPWSATASVINNSTSEPPHSGSWDAWLDGYGTTHTDTLMQQVSIPSNATGAALSFWLHIDTAETSTTTAFDTLALQIRNSSGTVLSTLRTFSNLNKNTGFAQQSFDLTSFAGQTIQINFVGTEDAMLQTSFVLDDFALNVTTPSTTTDTTPPTTSISSPANGATVSGTVAVNASASDNVGVTQMQILIDGTVAASNTSATSLSFNWDTTLVPDGSHTIVSKAFDAAGNVGTSSTVTVTVSNGTTTTSELILNGGFENGTTTSPWVLTTGVISSSASEPAHTGSWDAWMDGYGTTHTDTAMQQVAIPSTATAASLSFWLHIDTAETTTTSAFDTLTVQVRDSAGNVLSTLATFSNLNHATGYQQHSFDLTAFHGQTVQIFFSGTEDSSLQTSFVLDDVSLQVTQ